LHILPEKDGWFCDPSLTGKKILKRSQLVNGFNLFHLCFPHAEHDETSWGMRLHLPMQFINGAVARASRVKNRVLRDKS
jgi:hypothetical protein